MDWKRSVVFWGVNALRSDRKLPVSWRNLLPPNALLFGPEDPPQRWCLSGRPQAVTPQKTVDSSWSSKILPPPIPHLELLFLYLPCFLLSVTIYLRLPSLLHFLPLFFCIYFSLDVFGLFISTPFLSVFISFLYFLFLLYFLVDSFFSSPFLISQQRDTSLSRP